VPRVRQEAELPVQEYDSVSGLQEVLRAGGATGASGEVVDEADCLILQRDGRTTGCYESDASTLGGMALDEGLSMLDVAIHGGRLGIGGEVVSLWRAAVGLAVFRDHVGDRYRSSLSGSCCARTNSAGKGDLSPVPADNAVSVQVSRAPSPLSWGVIGASRSS